MRRDRPRRPFVALHLGTPPAEAPPGVEKSLDCHRARARLAHPPDKKRRMTCSISTYAATVDPDEDRAGQRCARPRHRSPGRPPWATCRGARALTRSRRAERGRGHRGPAAITAQRRRDCARAQAARRRHRSRAARARRPRRRGTRRRRRERHDDRHRTAARRRTPWALAAAACAPRASGTCRSCARTACCWDRSTSPTSCCGCAIT